MSSSPMSLRDATRLRLEETLGQVPYDDLRAHLDRDAVFLVDAGVSLLDCAVSIAMDDVESVRAWIDARQIRKPSRQERKDWPACEGRLWWAVVVEPYLLVQNP